MLCLTQTTQTKTTVKRVVCATKASVHLFVVVMNPIDHPHGGGGGRTSGGRHPVTPWGKLPKVNAPVLMNKASQKLIIRSRHAKKGDVNLCLVQYGKVHLWMLMCLRNSCARERP